MEYSQKIAVRSILYRFTLRFRFSLITSGGSHLYASFFLKKKIENATQLEIHHHTTQLHQKYHKSVVSVPGFSRHFYKKLILLFFSEL